MLLGDFGNEFMFERKWSVHWHGYDLPHEQDGVPFVAQEQPVDVGAWIKAHESEDKLKKKNKDKMELNIFGKKDTFLNVIKRYFGRKYNPCGLYRSGFSHNRIVLGPGIPSHPIYEPRALNSLKSFVSLEESFQNPTDGLHEQFNLDATNYGVEQAYAKLLKNPIKNILDNKLSLTTSLDIFEDDVVLTTKIWKDYDQNNKVDEGEIITIKKK